MFPWCQINTQILVDFWEWPIVTSTDVSFKAKVDFPAVTICNLNRINCHNAFEVFIKYNFYIFSILMSRQPSNSLTHWPTRKEDFQLINVMNSIQLWASCKSRFPYISQPMSSSSSSGFWPQMWPTASPPSVDQSLIHSREWVDLWGRWRKVQKTFRMIFSQAISGRSKRRKGHEVADDPWCLCPICDLPRRRLWRRFSRWRIPRCRISRWISGRIFLSNKTLLQLAQAHWRGFNCFR